MSTYALRPSWEWYLQQGDSHRKMRARDDYDRKASKRGTVTESDDMGCSVQYDDGTRSSCLDYMVELVKD